MALLKLCAYPGCRMPVPVTEKYCAVHTQRGQAREAKWKWDAVSES